MNDQKTGKNQETYSLCRISFNNLPVRDWHNTEEMVIPEIYLEFICTWF